MNEQLREASRQACNADARIQGLASRWASWHEVEDFAAAPKAVGRLSGNERVELMGWVRRRLAAEVTSRRYEREWAEVLLAHHGHANFDMPDDDRDALALAVSNSLGVTISRTTPFTWTAQLDLLASRALCECAGWPGASDQLPVFPDIGCDGDCGFERRGVGWQCVASSACGRYVHPGDEHFDELTAYDAAMLEAGSELKAETLLEAASNLIGVDLKFAQTMPPMWEAVQGLNPGDRRLGAGATKREAALRALASALRIRIGVEDGHRLARLLA